MKVDDYDCVILFSLFIYIYIAILFLVIVYASWLGWLALRTTLIAITTTRVEQKKSAAKSSPRRFFSMLI